MPRSRPALALISTAAIAVLALAGCGSGGHPAATSSSPPATSAAGTAPPTPTAAQAKFLADIAAAGFDTQVVAPILAAGQDVCNARQAGGAQSMIIGKVGQSGAKVVTIAEKDLCPQYLPSQLLKLSGNGIQDSAPFQVNSGTLTVTYTYDCANAGGSGNFIADITDGSDDQSVANALGAGGTVTTTVYPTDQGSDYHLSVNSECTWTVTVTSG